MSTSRKSAGEIAALAAFIAESNRRELPPAVLDKAKAHLLDTFAAMISGADLPPGRLAIAHAAQVGGEAQASLVVGGKRVSAPLAAFTNGMLAHADETDDSHAASLTHPGCAVVPAALAAAELNNRSGLELLNALVTGYDLTARINLALGPRSLSNRGHGPHSIGAHWGAGGAAAALFGFDTGAIRTLLSYVAHQTAGLACWSRDSGHVQKAFVFAAMPARNAIDAALLVASGFSGIDDVLSGRGNFLDAFSADPQPRYLTDGLGSSFEISNASIKKWCVGSPIQAALDSLSHLMAEHRFTADDVSEIRVNLPDNVSSLVDGSAMASISLQHCLALMLTEGTLTFAATHDTSRAQAPGVAGLRDRVRIIPDAELTAATPPRQAIVTVVANDGREMAHRTVAVRGTPANPMNMDEVVAKARDLIEPHLGAERADRLIEALLTIENLDRVADLAEHWR